MQLLGPYEWISFAVLAAFVALDSGPWLLSMLSRPLPASALLGMLWGDPAAAVMVGAVLEIVYAGTLPAGASRYPEAGLAAVAGTGVALWPASTLGAPAIVPGIVWGLVCGLVGKEVETWRRERNREWVAATRARASAGDLGAIGRMQLKALLLAAGLGALTASLALGLGMTLAAPFVDIAPRLSTLRPPLILLAAASCAAVLRLWRGSLVRATLGGGLVAGLVIGWLVIGGA
jgi:mannose/fructose/N-acetylgalactosamine-specific phosphotransferase system component IIC